MSLYGSRTAGSEVRNAFLHAEVVKPDVLGGAVVGHTLERQLVLAGYQDGEQIEFSPASRQKGPVLPFQWGYWPKRAGGAWKTPTVALRS